MAAAGDEYTRANFLRLQLLVTQLGTECLRKVFDREIPPGELHLQLQNHTFLIHQLIKKNIIKKSQLRLLRPPNGLPLSTTFDVTLIVTLLRNITTLKNQRKLWDEDDNTLITGIDKVSDIVRIRNLRNEVGICKDNNRALLFGHTKHAWLYSCVQYREPSNR